MNEIIASADCACNSTCSEQLVENIPGPAGVNGQPGADGTNGVDAFTTLTASFIQPSSSGNVTVSVVDSTWVAVGQILFIATAGYYQVASIPDGVSIELTNLGYTGNAAPTTVITSTQKVSPGGIKGTDGSSGTGDMLRANNLSDVLNVATSRSNLGLGTLAVLSSINDGNWLGTDLNVTNGGTGASTAANARTNLGVQAVDPTLTALAALVTANNDMLYFTGVDAPTLLSSTTAFGRSALLDATAAAARTRLGNLLPRYGVLGSLTSVNLNSATTDNAVAIESARYRIDKIVVENASVSVTTATSGVFTAAGGAGTTIAADQSLAALTASTKFKDLTLGGSVTADVVTAGTIYYRVGTAQGVAATANVWVIGWKFD